MPGNNGSNPLYFTEYDGKMYFGGMDDIFGYGMWVSDGTPENTHPFMPDIAPNTHPLNLTFELYAASDAIYFRADYTDIGYELYRVVNPNLSVTDFAIQDNFQVYPNPTKDILNISTSEKTTFSLNNGFLKLYHGNFSPVTL